jgi:hypothetical protein
LSFNIVSDFGFCASDLLLKVKLNKMKITKITIGAIVIAGIAFWGGVKYDHGNNQAAVGAASQNRTSQFASAGQRGARANANGGFISGEIISKDSQSVTVKLRDGSSKIVLYSPSTAIEKNAAGTSDDLTVGKQVTVTGTQNSNGSISAKTLQVRPVPQNNAPNNTQN